MSKRIYQRSVCPVVFLLTIAVAFQIVSSPANSQGLPKASSAVAEIQPGGLSGRVIRADTKLPLPKAVVTVWLTTQPRNTISVRTDSRGTFDIPKLPPGGYRLRTERKGFASLVYGQRSGGPASILIVKPGETLGGIEVALEPAGVISGSVVDQDQEPVEGIEISALRVSFAPGGREQVITIRTTRTDDRGYYRLSGLPASSYYVQAGGPSETTFSFQSSSFAYGAVYYPATNSREEAQRVRVTAGQEASAIDLEVHSTTTYTIRGVILDSESGSKDPPGRKSFNIGFVRGGGMAMVDANSDGSFKLGGLPPGEYTLVGDVAEENRPSRRAYQEVRIVNSDVYVTLDPGRVAELQGAAYWVNSQAKGFTDLRIILRSQDENGISQSTPLDPSGKFALIGLSPGKYRFEVMGQGEQVYVKRVECGGEDHTLVPLQLEAGQKQGGCEVTLASDVLEVRARVIGPEEGNPVQNAVVILVPRQAEKRSVPRYTVVGKPDDNGQFRLTGVIPGEYFAFAVPASEDSAYFDPEFPERNRDKVVVINVTGDLQDSLDLKFFEPR